MTDVYTGICIDGDNGLDDLIHLMAYPSENHEFLVSESIGQFKDFFRNKPSCRVYGSNTGLFIGHRWEQIEHFDSVRKAFKEQIKEGKQKRLSISPDLQVICNSKSKDFDYRGYHGIPKLVMEIHSPSTGIDDVTWKKDIYETFGIPEYWVIQDIENVGIFSLVNGKYELTKYQTPIEEDILEIPSQVFDGLVIKLNRRDILGYE
jgi:Uma2 family endonuclease